MLAEFVRATACFMNSFARFSVITLAMAMPHHAMTQLVSSLAAWRNERSASKYQKPWSCPRPWLKNFCESALVVDTGKSSFGMPSMR